MFLVDTSPTFQLDVGSASVGTITVDITRADGTALVSGGSTTDNNDGTYDYTLTVGNNDQLDLLKVDWTISSTSEVLTTYEEIVGGLLFTVEQARNVKAKDDASADQIPLNSSSEYSDSRILTERQRITEDLESWTGRSWIPRYVRVELSGNGRQVLSLRGNPGRSTRPQARTSSGKPLNRPGRLNDITELLAVSVGGTSQTVSDYEVDGDRLIDTTGYFTAATISDPFNVVVEYVYGLPYQVDGVDRIAMMELVDRLVPSPFPDRLITADTDYGTTRFVQPGGPMNNVSRLPQVNHWVKTHNRKILVG